MKLTIILLTITALQVSAKGYGQGITLSLKDVTLKTAFFEIRKQAPAFDFFYEESWLKEAKTVTIEAKNATLDEVLKQCLKNQPFTFSVSGTMITLRRKEVESSKKIVSLSIILSGLILDEENQPIQGVSVKLKNSDIGATTNQDGVFTLANVPGDGILVISHISYESREVEINNQADIKIILKAKVGKLQDVTISNGYQTFKGNTVVGSVTTIPKAQLEQRIAFNIVDKLEGITNGMVFNKDVQGANKIRIRGESTIYGYSEPLLVVDNFPYDGPISDINPNDIENITVLKDASAASIWGVRAGNGVIVITTKRGKVNQPLRLEVNVNTTIEDKPNLYYRPTISPSDYIDLETYLYGQGRYDGDLTDFQMLIVSPVVEILNNRTMGLISSNDSMMQIDALRKNDWRREYSKYLFRPSIAQQYQINLSGGSAKSSYFFSAGYDDILEDVVGNHNRRITLNNGLLFRPFSRLELQTTIGYAESLGNNNGRSEVDNFFPYMRLKDDNGNELPVPQNRATWEDTIVQRGFYDQKYYPLQERNLNSSSSKIFSTRLATNIQYNILQGLNIGLSYQFVRSGSNRKDIAKKDAWLIRNYLNTFAIVADERFVGSNFPNGAIQDLFSSVINSHNARAKLDYNRSWQRHSISAMAGVEVRESKNTSNASKFYGFNEDNGSFVNPDFYTDYPMYVGTTEVGAGTVGVAGLQYSQAIQRTRSLFSNVLYTYLEKYAFSASARLDQANIFGVDANKKGTPLWSVGARWDVSKEKFYKSKEFPDLSFRLTYGYQGNISPNAVAVTTLRIFDNAQFTFQPYARIDNFPNPQLRWEKSGQLNAGVNFSTKRNIVSGSVDYFVKNGIDLIGQSPIDPTTGVISILGNFSDMQTRGLDLMITTRNLDKKVKWTSTIIFNYAKDKVTRYDFINTVGSYKTSFASINPLKGYPLYSIFTYKWAGLDPTNGDPRVYLGDTITQKYSNSLTSKIQLSDLKYAGRYNPPYAGSIMNTFSIKEFSLSFNVTYKLGHYFRRKSVSYAHLLESTDWQESSGDFAYRWQKPGDELITNVPSLVYPSPGPLRDFFYTESDILIEKADHVRLQFINLTYSLKESLVKRLKIQDLAVSAYVNNVGIIWKANNKGIDPDYPYLPYPPKRSYALGIKMTL